MRTLHPYVVLLLAVLNVSCTHAARILGVVPTASISHQLPFRLIALELARRGHDVTVITADPIKRPVQNYSEIDISFTYEFVRSNFGAISMVDWSADTMINILGSAATATCEMQMRSPQIQEFLQSEPTFDLMILEQLVYPCYYGLAHRVGLPHLVGFTSLGAIAPILSSYGNPNNPSISPEWLVPYTDHMNFWQRLHNTYVQLRLHYMFYYQAIPEHDELTKKYLGSDIPSAYEIGSNFSLLLVYNHFVANYPRAYLPNVVELTGLHIETERKSLPKDLQKWLDDSKEGVVYFSMGTNVRSSSMPEEKLKSLLAAFSRLPQKVLWKWDKDSLAGLPSNVKIAKWLPQQDLLAHHNVKLFISQGGLQSFNEAVYHAVPLLGIPVFADQAHNVAKMVDAGVAVKVEYNDITEDSVYSAIRTVLNDDRYSANMRRLSAVFREHQAQSLPSAIWWIEYVLRHGGAHHLRSAALDLRWWQLLLLDVAAAVLAGVAALLLVVYLAVRWLLRLLLRRRKDKQH